ncbi:MAG: hypothetical protein U0996_01520 [Planctomycetaceae bacterium]
MSAAVHRSQAIESLRRQLRANRPVSVDASVVCTGLAALDEVLPGGGLPQGSVIEWISDEPGQSATSLALRCAAPFLAKPGCLAVIDEGREFFPASLEAFGIPLSRLLLVRANSRSLSLLQEKKRGGRRAASEDRSQALTDRELHSQSLWALEQAARCRGVAVVLSWLDRCSSAVVRRLQLATENSGVTVMLIRPASSLKQPSFVDLRLHVTSQAASGRLPAQRSLRVSVLKSRQKIQACAAAVVHQNCHDQFVAKIQ